MDHAEYVRNAGRHLAELGDATADLQRIVDTGLPIPAGYYLLTGKLWRPDGYGSREDACAPADGGISTFTHAEHVQAACKTCGTVRHWLAPDCSLIHERVSLHCAQCARYASHDEMPGRDLSFNWERSRVLVNGHAPIAVA